MADAGEGATDQGTRAHLSQESQMRLGADCAYPVPWLLLTPSRVQLKLSSPSVFFHDSPPTSKWELHFKEDGGAVLLKYLWQLVLNVTLPQFRIIWEKKIMVGHQPCLDYYLM